MHQCFIEVENKEVICHALPVDSLCRSKVSRHELTFRLRLITAFTVIPRRLCLANVLWRRDAVARYLHGIC